jgi:Tol biopolymer transport system component/DNA-binding winged helix-turn-helix (wHTH) protein
MASPAHPSPVLCFGGFELDAAKSELRKGGVLLKVHPQPFRVLLMLAEGSGQIVTREEIRRCLWGDNTFVDFERGINFCVNQIRATLGDDADHPRYIETIPRRGYRFIAPVSDQCPVLPAATSESVISIPHAPGLRVVASHALETYRAPWKRKSMLVPLLVALVLLVTAGLGVYRRMSRSIWPNFQKMQITKLTDSGKATSVAISADGRYVAYLFQDGGNSSLRLRQVGTQGEAQILVHDARLVPGLAFSPAGDFLYFSRSAEKSTEVTTLYRIPVLGGPEKKLITDIDSPVSFSPDGKQFAYTRGMPRQDTVEIRTAAADGSDDRLLVSLPVVANYKPGAIWSPDGRNIAVPVFHSGSQSNYAIDIISVSNGNVSELYQSSESIGVPRWRSGGDALLVPVTDPDGRTQLWAISYPGGQAQRLTNDLADYDLDIDATRDGAILAAIARTTVSNVWIFPGLAVTRGKQITSREQQISNIFSRRDGKIVALNQHDNGLWVINPDGSQPRLLMDAHDVLWFSGCGPFILFVSWRNGTSGLTRMDEDGSNPKLLAPGGMMAPNCSPDQQSVFYAETGKPRWKIRRVPIDGGAPADVLDNPGESIPGNVVISPDGKLLAFPFDVHEPEPAARIAVVQIESSSLIKTFDTSSTIVFTGPRWSPDGKGLQYLLDRNGATNLWEQPLAGGPPKQLTTFTSGQIFDFNWTAGGKQLLLCRGETSSDVVLLSNLR